ncbi:YcfA-like protein [Sphingobacterium spiritivorum]|uniref:YcfA-like protein n=1 Tax=Sphingobacterium spiritivorum TaxID=258 RepID=A0A380CGV3_SPHSI|nr:type II toxin-antitoxin system HicA family toxin [Sphingobacterium spiritivorum]SUJ19245.1 YcfA-like protein [Sphingobacterium spiritivorum]
MAPLKLYTEVFHHFSSPNNFFPSSVSSATGCAFSRSNGSPGNAYPRGWNLIRISGSHYIYEKDGRTYPIPYHGSKEIGEGLRKKIMKDLGLK